MTYNEFKEAVNAIAEYEEFAEKASGIGIDILWDDTIVNLEIQLVELINREFGLCQIYDERGFNEELFGQRCAEITKPNLPYYQGEFNPEYTIFDVYVFQTRMGKDLPIGAKLLQEKYPSIFEDTRALYDFIITEIS